MSTRRTDFFNCINRIKPQKIPFYFSLCKSLEQTFQEKTDQTDYYDYFDCSIRPIFINQSTHLNDYSPYFRNLDTPDFIDEWGVGHIRGKNKESYHFSRMVPPMRNFTTTEEINQFPLPDLMADYRWSGIAEKVSQLKDSDYITINGDIFISIFETAWYLRGLDTMLMDFILNPELANTCLDRITNILCQVTRRYAEIGYDVIVYGDDVGTQLGMMMSTDTWRTYLKPRLKKVIEVAKSINPEILCYYHSDGNIEAIIPELIEIGVDILNPIQPECMDPVKIKKLYGDKISFWGTIGTQSTMPFGSIDDVKRTTLEMINTVGNNGGLVIAPTHLLEPDVPWENIETFIETVKSTWR